MIPTLSQVCDKAMTLPAAPVLMPKIMRVLAKEDASISEFEQVIRLDTALAAATLRLANSAYFSSGGDGAENLEEAIQRLGQREVYRLAALAITGRWMNTHVEGFRWGVGDFCRFSLITALSAEYLAQKSSGVDPQTAYAAGLVHEIGKLALAYSCLEQFGAIRERQEGNGSTWLAAERAVLGYTHAEVGAALLRRWNFPPSLVAVAQYNPPAPDAPKEARPLLTLVHAGKFIATSIGAGVGEDGFLFELNQELMREAGLTPELIEEALPEVFERATRLLQDKLTHGALAF